MFNVNQLLKQAQSMQQKMQEAQDNLASNLYEAQSGGGLVSVTLNGKNVLQKINIDPSILKADEKEIIEDLIVAAFNEARKKVDEASKGVMDNMLGGMNLPPGFKMPF